MAERPCVVARPGASLDECREGQTRTRTSLDSECDDRLQGQSAYGYGTGMSNACRMPPGAALKSALLPS